MLDTYFDRGGNFVDTANIYTGGHSEQILGDALAARPGVRDRIVLASKFFANLELSTAQLERLGEISTPTLNFPADNNARFGPMLAFGGMTIDGVTIPSSSIAAEPAAR